MSARKRHKKEDNDYGTWRQFRRFSIVFVVIFMIMLMYILAAIVL